MGLSYSTWIVLLGTSLLGVVGGVTGSFALLRRQSLLGDALAHAALPGVCLAFLITGSKDPFPLLVGAMAAGSVGALFILLVVRGSRIKEDSAIGIVLSVFFGVGFVLLTLIQKLPTGNRSGLDRFLFGQAATLMQRDLWVFASVGACVLLAISLFHKEFKILCFDRGFGASLGFPMRRLEVALTCILVVVVVIGLQTVGVVLMVASLVTPAAAARQWTDRFGVMLIAAGAIGGATSALGALVSSLLEKMPTGPTIVLMSSCTLALSILFAPRRGMFWRLIRGRELASRIRRENLLKDLYGWGERQGTWTDPISVPAAMGIRGQGSHVFRRTARWLERAGLVELSGVELSLTPAGLAEAERVVRTHRIWELYLVRRLDLPPDHVHRDAEAMEHALTDETLREFEELLGHPTVDPHGRPIPPRRPADD